MKWETTTSEINKQTDIFFNAYIKAKGLKERLQRKNSVFGKDVRLSSSPTTHLATT
jgi:hypothetical protein